MTIQNDARTGADVRHVFVTPAALADSEDVTWLYWYFCANGWLLYVGITGKPMDRTAAHLRQAWHHMAAFSSFEVYPSRRLASAEEGAAIASDDGCFNTKTNASWAGPESRAQEARFGSRSGAGRLWFAIRKVGSNRITAQARRIDTRQSAGSSSTSVLFRTSVEAFA